MVEVHTPSRGQRRGAAIIGCAGLFVASLALAAGLARTRGLDDAPRIAGWAITFQVPRGWKPAAVPDAADRDTVVFQAGGTRNASRRLYVTRLEADSRRSLAEICFDEVLNLVGRARATLLLAQLGRPDPAPLGVLPGARMIIPAGAYVHVGARQRPGWASEVYVFEYRSEGPLQANDLRLGQVIADSVRLIGN